MLYHIEASDGSLIAHRFDVVDDLRFGEREVSYVDLFLDVWVTPEGEARVEDEDQGARAVRAGLLSEEQRLRIEQTKRLLLRRWRSIIREAEAFTRP